MAHDLHHGPSSDAPIVCDLNALNAAERRRHAALSTKVHGAVAGTRGRFWNKRSSPCAIS
jgi:hypothetical protein